MTTHHQPHRLIKKVGINSSSQVVGNSIEPTPEKNFKLHELVDLWGDDDSVVVEDPALRTEDKRSNSEHKMRQEMQLKSMVVDKVI